MLAKVISMQPRLPEPLVQNALRQVAYETQTSSGFWILIPLTRAQAKLEPLEAGSRPKVGLLASEATLKASIYQQKLEARVRSRA